jgi:hypothetical protein
MGDSGGVVARNRRGRIASTVPSQKYRRLRGKALNAGVPRFIGRSSRDRWWRDTHANKEAGGTALGLLASPAHETGAGPEGTMSRRPISGSCRQADTTTSG